MIEDYDHLLTVSSAKLLAEGVLRGKEIEGSGSYRLVYKNAVISMEMIIRGDELLRDVEPVPALVGERIEDNPEAELSELERPMLYLDSSVCGTFIRDNFFHKRYKDVIKLSERLIQANRILIDYDTLGNPALLCYQIEIAKYIKENAHICWENPVNKEIVLGMEGARTAGNKSEFNRLKKIFMLYKPK